MRLIECSSHVVLVLLSLTKTIAASRTFGSVWLRPRFSLVNIPRGGSESPSVTIDAPPEVTPPDASSGDRVLSLDEKVHAAMRKLGLEPPATEDILQPAAEANEVGLSGVESANDSIINCVDGLCELPENGVITEDQVDEPISDPSAMAQRISQSMRVDLNMAWAALGATSVATENNMRLYNEKSARSMIQMELDMIFQIQEDSEDVQMLVSEGFDSFFVRRALAFAERNVDDARAILLADKMDEEEEAAEFEAAQQASRTAEKKSTEASFKTVEVNAGFDPTKLGTVPTERAAPRPAARDDVIFEATAALIQELVLESPVPVLLDIYADWCGPCKALSPILEDMAVKSGGTLRLVKVNSDNERAVSQALEVSALPTIFGVRNGKILHMFQGMPRSEEMMKNFLMGLMIPGHAFNPPVSESEQQKYRDLSTKLMKVAASSSFSFSARERLQDIIAARIDDLVQQTGTVFDVEQSLTTMRSLLCNIIRDPYDAKFRTVNFSNKVIASKIAQFPACISILRSLDFSADGSNWTTGKGKPFVNVAPLSVARDAIDKWIDRTRYEVAREARRRRDEEDRVRVQAELAAVKEQKTVKAPAHEAVEELDPNACLLKFRIDGKKKIHEAALNADDPLSSILNSLPEDAQDPVHGEIQIICVAKRLVVKSTDTDAMQRSLRDYGLVPTASLVIKMPTATEASVNGDENVASAEVSKSSKLAERAAAKKKLKKGTHTMQSIGIYSTEDNAKGELIDGGGGTWYEQDVSDDDEEEKEPPETKTQDAAESSTDDSPLDPPHADEDVSATKE
jgi:thioredoxin 1